MSAGPKQSENNLDRPHLRLVADAPAHAEAKGSASAKDRSTAEAVRSGTTFVGASIAAGLLHYVFQVFASRDLPLAEFSQLNAWFAMVSMAFILPAILQYGGAFVPLPNTQIRSALIAAHFALIALIGLWFTTPSGLNSPKAVLVVCAASIVAWFNGQAQGRLLLGTLAVSSILIALAKLLILLVPSTVRVDQYGFALLAAYLPALVFLSFRLARNDDRPQAIDGGLWAAIILSLASVVMPQLDMVLLHATQDELTFQRFALTSLFFKGIYFFAFSLMQWLLPRQMRNPALSWRMRTAAFALGASIVLSALTALLGPSIAVWALHWSVTPQADMVFLACLNTCALTWLFVHIQADVTRGRLAKAAAVVLLIGIEAVMQLWLNLSFYGYMSLALLTQTLMILAWLRGPSTTAPEAK